MGGSFKATIAILAVIVIAILLAVLWFVTGSLLAVMTSEIAIAFLYVARLSLLVLGVFFAALLLMKIKE